MVRYWYKDGHRSMQQNKESRIRMSDIWQIDFLHSCQGNSVGKGSTLTIDAVITCYPYEKKLMLTLS